MSTELVIFAVDLDGTIDQAPQTFAVLMREWRGDGNRVVILTGNENASTGWLSQLGVTTDCYDQIVVLPGQTLPEEKAGWCKANSATVIIDNKAANCMACVAAGVPLALLPITATTVSKVQRAHLRRAARLLEE